MAAIEMIALLSVLCLIVAVGFLCWTLHRVSKRAVDAGEGMNYLLARLVKPMADVATANGNQHLRRMMIENERARLEYDLELKDVRKARKERPLDVTDEDDPASLLDLDTDLDEDVID